MRATKQIVLLIMLFATIGIAKAEQRTVTGKVTEASSGDPLPGANVLLKGTESGVTTDIDGKYSITIDDDNAVLVFSYIGMNDKEVTVGSRTVIDIQLQQDASTLSEVVVTSHAKGKLASKVAGLRIRGMNSPSVQYDQEYVVRPESNNESYAEIEENTFKEATKDPLSTFSIDVDAASYANVRRFINNGQRPPEDAVRIEEMINYFNYDYEQAQAKEPFSVYTELSSAPWNEKHQLVHIGIKGKDVPMEDLPASNLVFLIDVSGSMSSQSKLPLLKAGFEMLIEKMRPEDKVSIVVYAGAAGCVLPATSGKEKEKIKDALRGLSAGGSTAGGAGIQLAYKIAKEQFIEGGNNRVILATDGDFNVGASSDKAIEDLIEEKRKDKVFLTVLGFGMGNYKDSKMEILADKGNGNYAYIDNMMEAKKVFIHEFAGTLFTIAKDVKIQVEFNPQNVTAYRLIGYENRKLAAEDFNNDKKDAGEIGSGHTVTALYEIIPAGVDSYFKQIDDLKYQKEDIKEDKKAYSDELMALKIRYKEPDEDSSKLIKRTIGTKVVALKSSSENFKWSASVATFGMLLRSSDYLEHADIEMVLELARASRGKDANGYRIEFINMVESFSYLAQK